MRCVIVDDEVLAQKVLKRHVERSNFLKLVGVYGNIPELEKGLEKQEVDLIFLDVMLPEVTGIEFLRTIKDIPQVILVSSKKDFALEAFEHDVTDYLLKPIDYERFHKAAKKAQTIHQTFESDPTKKNEFFVKINQELVKIYLDEIMFVEAYGDYVKVHGENGKYVFLSTMKSLEAQLPADEFLRIHKSFIVRIDKITKVDPSTVFLEDKQIPVSRTYKENLKNKLNLLKN